MGELWTHMMSAQENIGGIPADFLEKKKEEIRQRKVCIGHTKCLNVIENISSGINTFLTD